MPSDRAADELVSGTYAVAEADFSNVYPKLDTRLSLINELVDIMVLVKRQDQLQEAPLLKGGCWFRYVMHAKTSRKEKIKVEPLRRGEWLGTAISSFKAGHSG